MADNIRIYHNPRCRKSRETLDIIKNKGIEPEIIEYLSDIPSEKQIADLIGMLGISPKELIRKNEIEFKPYKDQTLSDQEYISLMHRIPKLIERPIVVKGNMAVIGRPPEKVIEFI